ncbi:hypothetical protein BRETT_000334 [Brettanomyces bruxellensis]|uniref:Ribosomal protein bL31m N-terminal domain-containing protein n=1 Tax=Dekkera bruxellensis TaxID=5007 RepID=A0A871R7E1_DEKBR|nr:uncharacterized protein BRETT_000334 [Brettanomyces bruxellensis]QOU20624.1 hypothetical protein BRETT_000334 [Brettanomyces bruxellensis]
MFCSQLKIQLAKLPLTRSYANGPLKILSALPQRPLKKIRIGKARPAIYYKFNTFIELSDGSVIRRRSQYPREELRMITDQRNNPLWNPSKPDVSLLDAEAKGKLSKFKAKFAAFENSGKTEEDILEQREKEKREREIRLETGIFTKKKDEEGKGWMDVLESNYKVQKLGGKIAQKDKSKKKKKAAAAAAAAAADAATASATSAAGKK